MRFQVLLSLWSVTSWLCIDKIPEVAKTKVSNQRDILYQCFFIILYQRLCHAPLKRLIQTRPHISICYWLFKCRVLRVVCVWEREMGHSAAQRVSVCVCSRVWKEGDTVTSQPQLHHCVCHVTLFPSRAWTDGKTKDIINCLYFYFES